MMNTRRILEEEGEEGDGLLARDAKRRRTFLNSMREVMGAQYMQRHLTKMEPFLRSVVQDEVEKALSRHVQLSPRSPQLIKAAASKRYRLQFQNSLPQTVFTGSKIEAENRRPIQLALVDTDGNQIVSSGPLSSVRIEIAVLDGDFGTDGQMDWTEKEFNDNIVREREGKRPLLTGDLVVTLSNGVGYIYDAAFTDNSSWIRCRKFRLGAKISRSTSTDGRVHEAISEAFWVKDHRGELYKKHHPPALVDDVWRLEKIGKDGVFHKKLAEFGISTVQDFLRNLVMDRDRLRRVLGTGMSNKMWDATSAHARECILDANKIYSYCREQGVMLLFNCIYELIGVIIGGKCCHLDELTASQKALVNKLQQDAYNFPDFIAEFREEMLNDNNTRLLPMIDVASVSVSSLMDQHIPNLPTTIQDEQARQVGFLHPPHPPGLGLLEDLPPSRDISLVQDSCPIVHLNSFQSTNSFNTRDLYDIQLGDFQTSGLVNPSMAGENMMDHYFDVDMLRLSPYSMHWDHSDGLIQVSCDEASATNAVHASRIGSSTPSRNWIKLIAALKWMAISRRCSARRAILLDAVSHHLDQSESVLMRAN
ncbi:protein SAR DEFICIENT 1-like isoform X2 [Typha latifolia]|uniref:protein SAR DEFICIENT 1-like isoform X2 n=1 Tax=Typha latifolia TaxID=4733 RepID=UPI003C2C4144